MDREPLEPAVLAVELYREEHLYRRRSWMFAGIALACSLVGALAVLAAVRFAPHWFMSSPPAEVAFVPNTKPQGPANALYTEPANEPPAKKDPPKEPAKPTGPPATTSEGSSAPVNPFSGAIISRTPLPDDWKPGDPVPSGLPSVENPTKPPVEPVRTSATAILITARSSSGDPESEAAQVASSLQGAGASVRTAFHYSLAGGVIGVQIVATVPAGSVDSVMSRLASAGVGGADKWSGSADERADRVSGILSSRIRELRAKETELKEKFEDDATEVTVIREEIQKLNQGLGMVRSAKSAGVAVILVGIGSL